MPALNFADSWNADDENCRNQQRDEEGGQVKPISMPNRCGAFSRAWACALRAAVGCAIIAASASLNGPVPGCSSG